MWHGVRDMELALSWKLVEKGYTLVENDKDKLDYFV